MTNLDNNSCDSLRQVLAVSHANLGNIKTAVIATAVTNPILLDAAGGGGVTLGLGITLTRQGTGCPVGGPDKLVQGGTGTTGDGITLNGATLKGVWVSGFTGRQIVAVGGAGLNILFCVKSSKQNPN